MNLFTENQIPKVTLYLNPRALSHFISSHLLYIALHVYHPLHFLMQPHSVDPFTSMLSAQSFPMAKAKYDFLIVS